MEVICYVCNCPTNDWRRNLVQTKSQHSKTFISNFLKQFLGINFSRRDIDNESNCFCLKCINLIDVYDWMCVTTSEKEKELTDLFLATEATFVIPKVESEEAEFDMYDTQSNNSVYAEPFSTDFPEGFNDVNSEFDAGEDQIENVNWNTKTRLSCLVVNGFSNFSHVKDKVWVAKCKFCSKMVKYYEKINSNLKNHLKRYHPEILESFEAEAEMQDAKEKEGILNDFSTIDIDTNPESTNIATSSSTVFHDESDCGSYIDGVQNMSWNTKSRLSCSVLNCFTNFTQIEGKSWMAKCKFCSKMVKFCEKINTNLKNHLKRCRVDIWRRLEEDCERRKMQNMEKSLLDAEATLDDSHTSDIDVNAGADVNVLVDFPDLAQNKRQRLSDFNEGETGNNIWNTKSQFTSLIVKCFKNFTRIEGKNWGANCNLCHGHKVVKYRESINSNLKHHLQRCHPKMWNRIEKACGKERK